MGYDGKVITFTNLINWSEQTIFFNGETNTIKGVAYGVGQ